jgi:hypothetical protein
LPVEKIADELTKRKVATRHGAAAVDMAGRWQGCSIGCTCDDRVGPLTVWIEQGVVFSGVKASARDRERNWSNQLIE